MPVAEKNKVNVEKVIRVPAPRVFDAIGQGKLFFNCSGDVLTFENDFRVGGGYRVKFMGNKSINAGKYLEIVPQKKIVFTWGDKGADSAFPFSTVTIQLTPEGDSTRLRVEHTGFTTPEQVEAHNYGWNSGLTDLFAEIETHQLRVVRNFDVSPQKLFAACARIETFFKAVADVTNGTSDFKVGGHYRVPTKNGSVNGEYLEIDPGKKIKFSWEGACEGSAKVKSIVTLNFKDRADGGCSLELLHEKLGSTEETESKRQGWGMVTKDLLENQKNF